MPHLLVSGQSLASNWAVNPAAFDAFRETRLSMGDTSTWELTVAATPGSAMLKENIGPNLPNAWWCDIDVPSNEIWWGWTMNQALQQIQGKTITHAVWIQGQADAAFWDPANYDLQTLKYRYKRAFRRVAAKLFPAGKFHVNVLEVMDNHPDAESSIRWCHRELIQDGSALQGTEVNYDLVKLDGLHPSPVAGMSQQGIALARAIALP